MFFPTSGIFFRKFEKLLYVRLGNCKEKAFNSGMNQSR
jgi:hypothetical protein